MSQKITNVGRFVNYIIAFFSVPLTLELCGAEVAEGGVHSEPSYKSSHSLTVFSGLSAQAWYQQLPSGLIEGRVPGPPSVRPNARWRTGCLGRCVRSGMRCCRRAGCARPSPERPWRVRRSSPRSSTNPRCAGRTGRAPLPDTACVSKLGYT